jgi:hypothetical protein
MIGLVNPRTSRLGISTFWRVNYLPIIKSKYPIVEQYKYEHYIVSLESFFQHFFLKKIRNIFFKRLYYIYDTFSFNAYGFPGVASSSKHKSTQYFRLDIYLLDYYFHVYYGVNLRYIRKYFISRKCAPYLKKIQLFKESILRKRRLYMEELRSNFKKREVLEDKKNYLSLPADILDLSKDVMIHTDNLLRYNKQIRLIINFVKHFVICCRLLKSHMEVYMRRFKIFLRLLHFRTRLMRLHNYFFGGIPLNCIVHVVHHNPRTVTAKFLCKFIERQLSHGRFVPSIINLIFKFLKRNKRIKGLRIVCSGRFIRGKKKGYISRAKGGCTFGGYSIWTNKAYTIDYAETTYQLRTGMCGFRIWLCKWKHKLIRYTNKKTHVAYGLRYRYVRLHDRSLKPGFSRRKRRLRKITRRRFTVQV